MRRGAEFVRSLIGRQERWLLWQVLSKLPLAGAMTRQWALRFREREWFDTRAIPVLDDLQLTALILTLIVMFAIKGEVILRRPELIVQMVPPLALFFFALFFGVLLTSRRIGFCYADSATTAFHCTGRNFELAIAIALTAFASRPLVAVSTVIGPLIEVPLMLTIVYLARRLEWRLFGTTTAGGCPLPPPPEPESSESPPDSPPAGSTKRE